MPIYMVGLNEEHTIKEITGNDKTRLHLTNLGFVVGDTITVIHKVDDNVIVKIKGISLGISKELAKRIIV